MVTGARAMIGLMTSILVVQQQPELQRALQVNLRAGSYDVIAAGTGREAMALAARRPPDAVILDLSLPDVNAVEVIAELRHRYRAPIIVLSGRAGAGDKIGALDAGADDYVTKPFVMGELLARLRAKLRRQQGDVMPRSRSDNTVIGRWQVDLADCRVTRADVAPGSSDPGEAPGRVIRYEARSTCQRPITTGGGSATTTLPPWRRSFARSRAKSSPISNDLVT